MFCTVCGEWGDINHFRIIDGEVFCGPSVDWFGILDQEFSPDLQPFWFGGTTNEEGEVYSG